MQPMMSVEEYWAYLEEHRGLVPKTRTPNDGLILCQDANGDFFEVPDPDPMPDAARAGLARQVLSRLLDHSWAF